MVEKVQGRLCRSRRSLRRIVCFLSLSLSPLNPQRCVYARQGRVNRSSKRASAYPDENKRDSGTPGRRGARSRQPRREGGGTNREAPRSGPSAAELDRSLGRSQAEAAPTAAAAAASAKSPGGSPRSSSVSRQPPPVTLFLCFLSIVNRLYFDRASLSPARCHSSTALCAFYTETTLDRLVRVCESPSDKKKKNKKKRHPQNSTYASCSPVAAVNERGMDSHAVR